MRLAAAGDDVGREERGDGRAGGVALLGPIRGRL